MVTCLVDLCRLESSDKHFWSLPDVQSLNVHLRILCLSFGRLQSGGIRFSRIIPHKMFKLTFEAVHRFVAGTSPPVARLSPRSPLTIFRYFPSFSSSSILRFFVKIHLKLLKVAADHPELLLQLPDLGLLCWSSLHRSTVFRLKIREPWSHYTILVLFNTTGLIIFQKYNIQLCINLTNLWLIALSEKLGQILDLTTNSLATVTICAGFVN